MNLEVPARDREGPVALDVVGHSVDRRDLIRELARHLVDELAGLAAVVHVGEEPAADADVPSNDRASEPGVHTINADRLNIDEVPETARVGVKGSALAVVGDGSSARGREHPVRGT